MRKTLFGFFAAAALAAPAAAQPKAADFDAVYDALRDNPALRGAYVAVAPEGIRPYVDEDQADAQTQALAQALAAGPLGANLLPAERLPVSRLVARLQEAVEYDPALAGVKIGGVYFDAPRGADGRRADEPHKRWLYVYGRVSPQANRKEVRDRLEAIAVRAMERGPAWAALLKTEQVAVKLDLTEVPPSAAAALINYRAGVKSYFGCDYRSAALYFADALVEDPTNPTYVYWRVLAEIGAGDIETAYRHLRPVAIGRRGSYGGTFDDLMLQPFERVQGPIRSTLHELERRALIEPVGPTYR